MKQKHFMQHKTTRAHMINAVLL